MSNSHSFMKPWKNQKGKVIERTYQKIFFFIFFLDLFDYSYSDSKDLRIDLKTLGQRSLRKDQPLLQ